MTELDDRRRLLVRGSIFCLGVVGAVSLLWGIAYTSPHAIPDFLGCPFLALTGLHCPGCGTTRAVRAGLHGEFRQAFAYNQIAIVVIPLVAFALIRSVWSWVWNLPIRNERRLPVWCGWLLIVVMILYAVLRNLPGYPFSLLAPHELNTAL